MKTLETEKNSYIQTALLVLGAFIFAYSIGIVFHEIGHVLAYKIYGVSTTNFVIQPLGQSFMSTAVEVKNDFALGVVNGAAPSLMCLVRPVFFYFYGRNKICTFFHF